jgi:hypothetical protein
MEPEREPVAQSGTARTARTGAEQPWEPADLAVANGEDPTPENIEKYRKILERDPAAAIEKTVP